MIHAYMKPVRPGVRPILYEIGVRGKAADGHYVDWKHFLQGGPFEHAKAKNLLTKLEHDLKTGRQLRELTNALHPVIATAIELAREPGEEG